MTRTEIELERRVHRHRTQRLDLRFHRQQHALHIRVINDRCGRVDARHRRLALHAGARPFRCLLIGSISHSIAFETHRQTRRIHHHEHVFETTIGLTDEITDRALLLAIGHHTSWARMDTELVFDRNTLHIVALADRPVGVHQKLRHDEHRNALDACRCSVDTGQHEMDRVGREIVITVSDEDLLAEETVMISIGLRTSPNRSEVRTCLRLGEVHRAGPLAAHHLGEIKVLLFFRAVLFDRFDGTLGQHRA